MKFKIESTGIVEGQIVEKYGNLCEEKDKLSGVPTLSMPLAWKNPPMGTKSFAITMIDYDNVMDEGVPWIHWLVADISKDQMELTENESRINKKLVQGTNSWVAPFEPYGCGEEITAYYGGPSPATKHEYEIKIYALAKKLNLTNGFYYNQFLKKIERCVLCEATLKGYYGN